MLNPLAFLYNPQTQWKTFADTPASKFSFYSTYPFIMSLLPSIAWYYGTTQIGWSVDGENTVKLTESSAMVIAALMYVALIGAVIAVGYSVHWMAKTYGSETTVFKGIALSAFAATPFFIFGASGFYPSIWIDLILFMVCICWSVYLLYTGIPIAMKIPDDRGFMYASAILSVGMVIFLVLLGSSVILWEMGAAPVFTD
ncbi:Inner membrane protein YohC [BD1-7 clade bacterium]|uniref:Inner membrane protein YohC n=1 Tax=BD1-7 clade bacterium TaxID=2029982 RepID=A0A5S9QYM3_9GAMM|nr:Inner membrane protein YohC [BD1-7 clade bacterium]CAA0121852.1 Inner membrane protein YohC [BD1-7 clade bacterium]CAA0124609.1 Inner membrane protein YohC [BD1-7 clade bacterium]